MEMICFRKNELQNRAWWAAVYGVVQSWTRLKQLSSSSTVPYGHPWWLRNLLAMQETRTEEPGGLWSVMLQRLGHS